LEEFFPEDLTTFAQYELLFNEILEFATKYDDFFKEVVKENNINDIIYKQYITNSDRNYMYSNQDIYIKISELYENKKIDLKTMNLIINSLVKTNIRNKKKEENLIGLTLYQNYLTYFIMTKNYYKFVIEPYSNLEIDFAKVVINDRELMMKHVHTYNGRILMSEKVDFEKFPSIAESDFIIKINGQICDLELTKM
jgi:hypothetical protein